MTDLTPNTIVSGLLAISRDLDELTKNLDQLEIDAVNAREDYTMAYAQAFLKAEGAMDVRRYQATVDTADVRLVAETAEALIRGRKRQIDTLKVRIDVGRSAAAALRAEITLGGVH